MSVVDSASCPTCTEPVLPGDQFCENCGNDLPADIAQAAPPPDAPPAKHPEDATVATTPTSAELGPTYHSCGGTFVDGWCDTCGDRQPDPRDHVELDLAPFAGAVSDKGLRHRHNEDGFALEALSGSVVGGVIGVVCDGVSSTVVPEQASEAASAAAIARLRVAPTAFDEAHADASAAVRAIEWTPKPDHGSPSCTFLAASVVDGAVQVAGMGDCRAYWVPEVGDPAIVTSDHSWANEQTSAGRMTLAEAMADRRAHVITRWLGKDADDRWTPDVIDLGTPGPGLLVLCSDGLWNYLDEPSVLAEQLAKAGRDATPTDLARHLVSFALDSGGHDNVTVLCIPVPERPADDPEPDA